jgi:hypothetical protein
MTRQQQLQPHPLRIGQIMPLQPVIIHGTTQAETTAKIYETRSSGGDVPRQSRHSSGAGRRREGAPGVGRDLQRQAWQWALAHRASDGSLPSGREIAGQYARHERWGRLVKRCGASGEFGTERSEPALRLVPQHPSPPADS